MDDKNERKIMSLVGTLCHQAHKEGRHPPQMFICKSDQSKVITLKVLSFAQFASEYELGQVQSSISEFKIFSL